MRDNILEIKNLVIRNKSSKEILLDSVGFDVERKKITGVVGESGSGKSITALSLLKLLPNQLLPEAGSALYNNGEGIKDLFTLSAVEHSRLRGKEISMIFQEPMTSLNPSMRCGRQVMESILFHQDISPGDARLKILDLFEKTGLPSPERIFSSYPHQRIFPPLSPSL